MAVSQPSPRLNSRYERFVERELRRAIQRVRLLDVAKGALGMTVMVLGYGLAMIVLDRWLQFPQWVRQAGFIVLLIGLGVYLWRALVTPLIRAVNPYYAALQVEQTIPDSKNSLVNWLDLHDEEIAPSVKAALGQRAAEDLKHADLDQAIQSQSLMRLGVALFLLVLGFLFCLFLFRGEQFQSLLARAFQPFGMDAGIRKQTRLSMLEPSEGHATVATHQGIRIRVHVDGRIPTPGRPDAPRLLLRYSEKEPYEVRPLEPLPDARDEWAIVLTPNVVRTGFWYKVVGGDDETPEYRVQVRASPSIVRFDLLHTYRPYLRWESRRTDNPNIEDYRGTQVDIQAVTNRQVAEGRMVIESEGQVRTIPAEIRREQPEVLRFRIVLEKDARYRINFTSLDGESNKDPSTHSIQVLGDAAPTVEFTKPEQLQQPEPQSDLVIPADGMLRLEGIARDDFGITNLTLHLVLDGQDLKSQPYLAARHYVLDTGGYVRSVNYKDDVDLLKIEFPSGRKAEPKPGQVLEFWLEAKDNCDFPGPQIGETRRYRVKIAPPRVDEKQQPKSEEEKQEQTAKRQERDNERKIAEEEKREHEQKHEQDSQQQSAKDRQEQQERQQTGNQFPSESPNSKAEVPQTDEKREQGQQSSESSGNPEDSGEKQEDRQSQSDSPKDDPTAEKIEKIKQELLKEAQASEARSEDQSSSDPNQSGGSNKAESTENNSNPKPSNQPTDGSGKNESGQPASTSKSDASASQKEPSAGDGAATPEAPKDGQQLDRSSNDLSQAGSGRSEQEKADGKSQPSGEDKADGSEKGGKERRPSARDAVNSKNDAKPEKALADSGNPRDPSTAQDAGKPAQPAGADRNPETEKGDQTGNSTKNDVGEPTKPNSDASAKGGKATDQPQSEKSGDAATQDRKEPKTDGKPRQAAKQPSEGNNGQESPKENKPKNEAAGKELAKGQPMPPEGNQDGANQNTKGENEQPAPRQQEIDRLAQQAMKQNGEGQDRDAAKQKLSQIAKNDPNPANRLAAQNALKQCEQCQNPGDGSGAGVAQAASPKDGPGKPTGGRPSGQAANSDGKPEEGGKDPAGRPAENQGQQAGGPKPMQGNRPTAGDQPMPAGDRVDGQKPSNNAEQAQGENQGKSAGENGMGEQAAGRDKAAGDKPGAGDNNPAAATKDPQDGTGEQQATTGEPKDGNMPGDLAAREKPGTPKTGAQQAGNAGKPSEPMQPGAGGNQPGFGNQERPAPAGGNSAPQEVTPAERNEEFLRRSGDLNLEQIDPKKLRELFKKYNLSEEEYKDWLARQAAKDDPKKRAARAVDFQAADRKGSALNSGVRRVESVQDPNAGKLYSGNTGQAPPEYRKAAERFAEMLAKPPESKPR